jgi:hypothetical protein
MKHLLAKIQEDSAGFLSLLMIVCILISILNRVHESLNIENKEDYQKF